MSDLTAIVMAIIRAISTLNPYAVLVWGFSFGVVVVVIEVAGGIDNASPPAKAIAICAAVVAAVSGVWWSLALVFALVSAVIAAIRT